MFSATAFCMKPPLAITKILHGFTLGLNLLQDKKKLYKDCRRSNTTAQVLKKLNHLQEQSNFFINTSKQNYYIRITKTLLISAKIVRHIGPY